MFEQRQEVELHSFWPRQAVVCSVHPREIFSTAAQAVDYLLRDLGQAVRCKVSSSLTDDLIPIEVPI